MLAVYTDIAEMDETHHVPADEPIIEHHFI